ncbi:MAG: pyrroloquinoline quinone biosynthesis peptide chaperone PqqD [Steroidobacteraceae bacterium]
MDAYTRTCVGMVMSKERGRRQNPSSRNKVQAPKPRPARVHLASGVRLDKGEERPEALVLVSPDGRVQLNEAAVAILRLCDGSRTRDDIVAEVTHPPRGSTLAADIAEFLDVARSRGWIIEA